MNPIDYVQTIFNKNERRTYLIDRNSDVEYTYKSIYLAACSVGNNLLKIGLKRGDRLAVLLNNSVDLAQLYYGCLFAGIVVVPLNPLVSDKELSFIITSSKSNSLITSEDLAHRIDGIKEGTGVKIILFPENSSENNNYLTVSQLHKNENFIPFQGMSPEDDVIIVYTSGTTGFPKGIVHSLSNLVENGKLFVNFMGIDVNARFFNFLQMTYLGGYFNLLLIPFLAQGSVVVSEPFNPKFASSFWDEIIKYEVNTLWMVPTIMAIVMQMDRGTKGQEYCKKSILNVFCGTAPLPTQLKKDFENRYNVIVSENYGLSETLFVSSNSLNRGRQDSGVGFILGDVDVRIVDRNNKRVANDIEGEIQVKSNYLMKNSIVQDKENKEIVDQSNYFSTGDQGKISQTGQLFITGRIKDLIIRGGVNISPAAIEDILYNNKSINECAVVGVPHKIMGEEIIAVISCNENVDFEALRNSLKSLCKNNLPTIQQPSEYLELESLPHTHSGKIQKAKLRSWILNRKSKMKQESKINIDKHGQHPNKLKTYYRVSGITKNSNQASSIKYNNEVYEMKRKGIDVTVLSLGEAFFDIPLYPMDDLPFPDIYHYSHSRGIIDLREKIAQYFLLQYDVRFNPETEIIITAGSKIAIHMALMAILNQGDEAIYLEPAWVSYPEQIKLCYGVPVGVPYNKSIFEIEEYVTNRTKVIIINSPQNPSGKVFTIEELSYLHRLAEKHNLFILSDEAYSDFLLDADSFISMGNLDSSKDHTIICNSISKNYGISGWRLGYVITNEYLINEILKINQHLITCPATILEHYISKHFFEIIEITKPQIHEVVLQRQTILNYMDLIGLHYLPGTATFYIFVSIDNSKLSSDEIGTKLLREDHVCVVPGIGYGNSCDRFVRIGVGAEPIERIKKGLDKLKALIKKTS